jgi:UDP-N-acetylglucosamine 2-epimerase (non-hydrolysing)/GDP/UDP-N,N'-diacetylbacillosamine 2-epimerase (hydrolysing)
MHGNPRLICTWINLLESRPCRQCLARFFTGVWLELLLRSLFRSVLHKDNTHHDWLDASVFFGKRHILPQKPPYKKGDTHEIKLELRSKPPMSPKQTARHLAVVSSSRADLAHLIHPLRALEASPAIELTVLATGAMLQPEFGKGVERLQNEGFRVEQVPASLEIDAGVDAARAIGTATSAFADCFHRLAPDLLMVVADRFEMLAPASAALAMRLPIVHVEGGERSEGAIDDAVRNALTKLSHLHLVTTPLAARRVLALGEEPWRVHTVGAGSLDHLRLASLPDRDNLESSLELDLEQPLILVGIHPVTLAPDPVADARALIAAIEPRPEQFLFAFPNADEGGRTIRAEVEALARRREGIHLFTNLPPESWFGLLRASKAIIGNSSSVLMESPSIPIPAVCVGDRQSGRERAANVVDSVAEPVAIQRAIEQALGLDMQRVVNPYGDGDTSGRIVTAIEGAPDRFALLSKKTTLLDDAREPTRLKPPGQL